MREATGSSSVWGGREGGGARSSVIQEGDKSDTWERGLRGRRREAQHCVGMN